MTYNLMHRDKLIHTGDLEDCFRCLLDIAGEHTSLYQILSRGWKFNPVSHALN